MQGQGLLVVIDALGVELAALKQENAQMKSYIEQLEKQIAEQGGAQRSGPQKVA